MTEQHWLPLKIPSNKAKVHFFSGRLSARRWFFDTQAIFSRNGVETCVIGVKKAWIGQEYRAYLQKNCPRPQEVNHFPQFTALEMKSFGLESKFRSS